MARQAFRTMVLCLSCSFAGGDAFAQPPQELSFSGAARAGLTPIWSRAITIGKAGGVTGVTVHPSPTKTYEASELIDKHGRRVFFSDRDLRAGTSRAGYDQTARLAEIKRVELESRGLEPRVEKISIPDVTLYVRSTFGTVMALDAETGRELWTTQAGKAGYPNYPVSATEDRLVTMSGSTIYIIDAANGQIVDSIRTRKAPGAAPTLYGGFIYLPTTQGLIEVYELADTSRVDFTMGSSGRLENPVTVSPNSVSWTTDQGYVYVGNLGVPGISYRFQSLDAITSAPVYMDETLYATSRDGFTYAINEKTGSQKWSYSAGGSTSGAPLAFEGHVYVTTTEGRMSCIVAATGEEKWIAMGVQEFVGISRDRLYCVTHGSQLTAFDKDDGQLLATTSIPSTSLPVLNTTTDRVYLVTGSGILQCFRETDQRWPIVRMPPVKEPSRDAARTSPAQPSTPAASPTVRPGVPSADEPDAADPFADFGDANATPADVGDDAPVVADDPSQVDDPFGVVEGADGGEDTGLGDAEDDPFADFE